MRFLFLATLALAISAVVDARQLQANSQGYKELFFEDEPQGPLDEYGAVLEDDALLPEALEVLDRDKREMMKSKSMQSSQSSKSSSSKTSSMVDQMRR